MSQEWGDEEGSKKDLRFECLVLLKIFIFKNIIAVRQDVPLASIFKTFISEDSLKITEGGQPLPVCIFGGTTEKSLIIYMRLL